MAFIRGKDLKALAAQIQDDDILLFDMNEETGKIAVSVVNPEDMQGCSGCGTCETPCSNKKAE